MKNDKKIRGSLWKGDSRQAIGDRGVGGTETLKIPEEFLKRGNLAKQVTGSINVPHPSGIGNLESGIYCDNISSIKYFDEQNKLEEDHAYPSSSPYIPLKRLPGAAIIASFCNSHSVSPG